MHFFIITPSFNQRHYLRRCVASVADQVGKNVRVHHHIQDGGSTDGTVDWLRQCHGHAFSYQSAPDGGMYDALNQGLARSDGAVVAWLNCDEQYLPGSLEKVARFFSAHPKADFVYGDTLNVDPAGTLLTYRKNPTLRRAYVAADHLYIQSASMFFRARVFERMRFDCRWQAVSDCDLVVRLLNQGFRAAPIRTYLSVFTMTGENVSTSDRGREELAEFRREQSVWIRLVRWPLNGCRFAEKALRGGYIRRPLTYAIYGEDLSRRRRFSVAKPSARFRWR